MGIKNWLRTWPKTKFGQSPKIPIIIPTFNNPTYLENMVGQLRSRNCHDIFVFDNSSNFPPMLDCLKKLERSGVVVIRSRMNLGPRLFLNRFIYAALPEYFVLTDPDLQLNDALPNDFLDQLKEATQTYKIGKAGFALDISNVEQLRSGLFEVEGQKLSIVDWENQFWVSPLPPLPGGDPVYLARIDTTFALYNKSYFCRRRYGQAIRIGGRFTCRHLPWYNNNGLPHDEIEYYSQTQRHSHYLVRKHRIRDILKSFTLRH